MNVNRNFPSTVCRRRLIILAWFCLVSSFSIATPVAPCPADCECSSDGGGLRKATCVQPRWNGIAYPDIRLLELRPSHVDSKCNVAEHVSPLFPQLNSLSLRNCSLTTLPSDPFRRFKSLQEVDLSHNFLSHFSQSLFADNTKLRYANLENNPLRLTSRPLLWSDSIWEVNLARCNLSGRLPASTLAGLPNLRYLSLADNRLEAIAENSLPSGLKRLDLSGNSVANVPLSELHRLRGLKEIDVSRNPVNCTCQLMGFQNWVSSEGTIFHNEIRCALPAQFAGYSLVDVPQQRLCDVDDQWLASNRAPSGERFGRVTADEDDFLFDVQLNRVVGEESGHRHRRRSASQPAPKMPKTDDAIAAEGSGAEADDVESSGMGSTDEDEITTIASTAANSTEFSGSSEPTRKVKSSPQSTTSSPSVDDSSSRLTTVLSNNASAEVRNNTSKAISPDAGATAPQKEPQSTELTDANHVDQETTTPFIVVLGNSISKSQLIFQQGEENGTSDSTMTSTSSSEAILSKTVADLSVRKTSSVSTVSAEAPNSTQQIQDLTPTPQKTAENETESTTLGQKPITQEEREQREKESHPVGSGATRIVEAPPNVDDDSEITTLGTNETQDEGGSKSTGQPTQGQMTKNEPVESATSTPYIIPSLLIVAVALVCLAIYFSQHNCRPKRWNRNDAKTNGPATELQDVSLLREETRRRNSDLHSKKYETEGLNPQTEKLTNGDGDYPAEENGALLADDRLPRVTKSTTRVTTNYESLPKTPIIIQKS